MIPRPAVLRREADEVWSIYRNEDQFRMWVEGMWTPRINAARHAGDITNEDLRLAFDALLAPIPYRRRFGRMVRMTVTEARAELADCGTDVSGLTDEELVEEAREFGIRVVLADDVSPTTDGEAAAS